MAATALPGRLTWQLGTVVELVPETPRARSIVLDLPGWAGHRAGQHVDVRLTAPDGYQAQRSYSIASAPEDGYLVLTVERLADGEVSPYLVDELRTGDQLELRGPIGGYFVWDEGVRRVLLVAGGSGIAPFRSMLRHRAAVHSDAAVRVLYSARSLEQMIYRDELMRLAADDDEVDIRFALTRQWPDGWRGHRGRVDQQLLTTAVWSPEDHPLNFVCGPSSFVETVAGALVAEGHPDRQIKTERFGPSG